MSSRLDQQRELVLAPKRMAYAIERLTNEGYSVNQIAGTEINFTHKGNLIKFYPYSGWYSGKGIGSGRGIEVLIKKLRRDASTKQQ